MRVAILYDRVNKWGGAERVLLALNELFPNAPLFTAVYDPKKALWAKKFPKVVSTFLNKIPYFMDKHELLGTFTPIAFETLDLKSFDLVISVTSEAAKGVITKPPTVHICYCLTPTRYLWSHHDFYFKNPPKMFGKIPFFYYVSRPFVWYVRYWDKIAAQRPDVYVAISTAVQKRVKKYYGRDSQVIYPPTDIRKFQIPRLRRVADAPKLWRRSGFGGQANSMSRQPASQRGERAGKYQDKKGDYFLFVSRLIPYKRADLAIEAFNELGLPLVIIGAGSEERRLRKMANGNIKFVGELTDSRLASYYQKAQALIFPQEEDFGMVVAEANAAGTPVIAYKAGGALDTVIPGKTGIFFDKQDKDSLIQAAKRFSKMRFDKKVLIKNAERFSKERFKKELLKLIRDVKG